MIDPAEEIPSYISIDYVSFTAGPNQGSSSHAITDAWIYIDGELRGAFEIPCKVPVLTEGAHSILVLPGVKQNGMSTLRAIYPHYKGWESTVELRRGQVTTLEPAFTYFPSVLPLWNSTFSATGSNFNGAGLTPYPGVYSIDSGPDAFETSSGKIALNSVQNYYLGTSADSFVLDPSQELYLECNYKCDQVFTVGLRNCNTGEIIRWLDVAPSGSWNKIYVRLNDALVGADAHAHYSVSFEMSNPAGYTSSTLWLDNLKLIN
jgi:hypothetical protein